MKQFLPARFLIFILMIFLFPAVSCVSDDYNGVTSSDEVMPTDFSQVTGFYKANPSDLYRVAFYKGAILIYRLQGRVPVVIEASDIPWNDEETVFFVIGESGPERFQWKKFIQFAEESIYVPPKGDSLIIGAFRKNRDMGNRLEFQYRAGRSGILFSLPVRSNDFSTPEDSLAVIEGKIEGGLTSPGGENPKAIIIKDLLVIQ